MSRSLLWCFLLAPVALSAQDAPDLWVLAVGGTKPVPAFARAGATIEIPGWYLQNPGGPAGAMRVDIVLSAFDNVLSPNDRVLQTIDVPASAGHSREMAAITITVPAAARPGTFWIGIIVDAGNQVTESNEKNNTRWYQLHVIAPVAADLSISAGATGPIATGDTASPHFVDIGAVVPVAPSGQLVAINGVKNSGSEAAEGVAVGYFLSQDDRLDRDDRRLTTLDVSGPVAANQTRQLVKTYLGMPADRAPGDYFILVVADPNDQVIETAGLAESNNVVARRIRILNVPSDLTPVYSVRARFWIGSGDNNGTDNDTHAMLNAENKTRMDYARDDFKPGSSHSYDLVLENVRTLGDIKELNLKVSGDDGLCLSRVTLEVNFLVVTDIPYPGCKWIEGPAVQVVNYVEMRVSPKWGSNENLVTHFTFSHDEVSSLIQAQVGNSLGQRFHHKFYSGKGKYKVKVATVSGEAKWGHYKTAEHITVKGVSSSVLQVNLEMYLDLNNSGDADLGVEFKLTFSCSADDGPKLELVESSITVDSDWKNVIQDLFVDGALKKAISGRLGGQLRSAIAGLQPGACFQVNADGSLAITA